MWSYRELIIKLTITDLKNKYQNTSLGFLWSILSPLLLSLVLYFVFRSIFNQEENFAINLLVGLVAWRFFAGGTAICLASIVSKPSLVTKVYIPRSILTLTSALSTLVSSIIEFLVLLPIIFILVGNLHPAAGLFPVVLLLQFWLIYGVGLFLAALFVYFRDLNQIWEVVLNIFFFLSPIVYPLSAVPSHLQTYYLLNPMTRIIVMYRDVLVAGKVPSPSSFLIVIGFGALAFVVGSYIFGKLQRRFAEAI